MQILLVATVAVSGVKLGYAWMVEKSRSMIGSSVQRGLTMIACGVMIAVGVFLTENTRGAE